MTATPDLRCPVCGGELAVDNATHEICCENNRCWAVWNHDGNLTRPSRLPDTERPELRDKLHDVFRDVLSRAFVDGVDPLNDLVDAALLETEGR